MKGSRYPYLDKYKIPTRLESFPFHCYSLINFSTENKILSEEDFQRLAIAYGHKWGGEVISTENRTRLLHGKMPEIEGEGARELENYRAALQLVDILAKEKKAVTLEEILSIHGRVMAGLSNNAGEIRTTSSTIYASSGEKLYQCPRPRDLPALLIELFRWLSKHPLQDPVVVAGQFHLMASLIHPFADGNGRTLRLVYRLMLIRYDDCFKKHPLEPALMPMKSIYCAMITESRQRGSARPMIEFLNACLFK